jgi:hypothetical protein
MKNKRPFIRLTSIAILAAVSHLAAATGPTAFADNIEVGDLNNNDDDSNLTDVLQRLIGVVVKGPASADQKNNQGNYAIARQFKKRARYVFFETSYRTNDEGRTTSTSMGPWHPNQRGSDGLPPEALYENGWDWDIHSLIKRIEESIRSIGEEWTRRVNEHGEQLEKVGAGIRKMIWSLYRSFFQIWGEIQDGMCCH